MIDAASIKTMEDFCRAHGFWSEYVDFKAHVEAEIARKYSAMDERKKASIREFLKYGFLSGIYYTHADGPQSA